VSSIFWQGGFWVQQREINSVLEEIRVDRCSQNYCDFKNHDTVYCVTAKILSKDSVTVAVDAVVYYHVFNPVISVVNVANAHYSTRLLAQTTLRNVLGTKNLSEILSDRENISQFMQVSTESANVLRSYSKNNTGTVSFLRHGVQESYTAPRRLFSDRQVHDLEWA